MTEVTPTRWRDRVKDSFKEKEVKKTVVSHWRSHKEAYIAGAVCIVGTVLMIKRPENFRQGGAIQIGNNTNTTTVINNQVPKRLSYIVTDGRRWWETQASAAADLGVTQSHLSKHLNHGRPLETGDQIERIGVRS